MMFKRMLTVVLAVACALALMPAHAEGSAGVPSPVRELTAEEMLLQTGVSFPVPDDAQDAAYAVITMGAGLSIAQAEYVLNGVTYCWRAQSGYDLLDLSGMMYEWTVQNAVELPAAKKAEVRYIEDGAGIILWYDAVGFMCYSLGVDSGASEDMLVAAAELVEAVQPILEPYVEPVVEPEEPEEDAERMALSYEVTEETWLNVRLAANATTGYEWKYEISDEEMLACDGTDYELDDNPEGLVGTGGTYIAAFSPTMGGAGAVTLTFRYARDWETEEPVETYVFDLWITEAGTLSVEDVK